MPLLTSEIINLEQSSHEETERLRFVIVIFTQWSRNREPHRYRSENLRYHDLDSNADCGPIRARIYRPAVHEKQSRNVFTY